jgi:zinc D-Ala-D-Ala carboxypeptidase
MITDWSPYPSFRKHEFDCRHTGRNEMQPSFMAMLQQLRNRYGRPMRITSGYRDPSHPVEARKATTGAHTSGLACDVAVSGRDAYDLVRLALELGFTGIGIQQKGNSRFIHLDTLRAVNRPSIWSY